MNNKKILVVVDMQNDFVYGALANKNAEAIIPNVVSKIKEYIENKDFIIFTKDTHFNIDYLNTSEGKNLPIKHCIKDSEGWDFIIDIEDIINNNDFDHITICKRRFGTRNFDTFIPYNLSSDIEIIGLCTDICVINNAMILNTMCNVYGKVTVDAACCAGVTRESHDVALQAMKACQIEVVNEGKEPWR